MALSSCHSDWNPLINNIVEATHHWHILTHIVERWHIHNLFTHPNRNLHILSAHSHQCLYLHSSCQHLEWYQTNYVLQCYQTLYQTQGYDAWGAKWDFWKFKSVFSIFLFPQLKCMKTDLKKSHICPVWFQSSSIPSLVNNCTLSN